VPARHPAAEPATPGAGPATRLSGPDTGPAAIANSLAAFAARFAGAAQRCSTGEDDDALHDTRVAARRLETALQLWRDAIDPVERRTTRRRVRRWRRRLSAARDLEVIVEALGDDALAIGAAEAGALAGLRESMVARRDRNRLRIAARCTPARLARLRDRLDRLVAGIAPAPDAIARADRRRARTGRAVEAALAAARNTEDDDALHAARIAVKKRRYAEDAFAAGAGIPAGEASASARALQRALGAVHDRAQLRDHLLGRARRAADRSRPELASALQSVATRVEHSRIEAIARFRSLAQPDSATG
jgi:CHAD domain-containing protein